MFRHPINPTTILLLAILFYGKSALAQHAPGYEAISTAQGLSQGYIYDLIQDKEGFIWAGTKNGLNRYDGYSFKVFTNDPYNPRTLSSNTIVKLFEDSKGRIWAGTEDAGLNIYDKKNGKFYRIAYNAADAASLSGNVIRSIEELPDGRMLVAVAGAGFNIVQLGNGFFEKNDPPFITRLVLPNDAQVYGIGKDKNGDCWISGMDGLVYKFDPSVKTFTKLINGHFLNNGYFTQDSSIIVSDNFFLAANEAISPLFDVKKIPAGNIILKPHEPWEVHPREIRYYDVSWWQPGTTAKWSVQLSPVNRVVYPFVIDRSGILWSGSVGYGLRKYNIASSKFKTQMPHQSVRWIIPYGKADMILGDYAYNWWRLQNDSVTRDPFKKIPSVTNVDNFVVSRTGDYWIKSDNKGYFKYNPVTALVTFVPGVHYYYAVGDKQPIIEDSKGRIWFSGWGGNFVRLDPATGRIDSISINTNPAKPLPPKAICTVLYEDHQGVVWAGTQEGFAKINFPSGRPQIKWYYNNNSNRNSLNYNHVSCFLDDPSKPDKYLWICTKGGGLNRLDKNTDDFFHLTDNDGMPDNVVYGILPDSAGNIWGSTNNGIFCLLANVNPDSNQHVFRNFSKAYGLQDDEFNTGAYAKLSNGNLAFGGVNGLNVFNPKEILTAGYTPPVFITNMLINNMPVSAGDKEGVLQNTVEASQRIQLNYRQDILTLEFSSLDFTAPSQNKYRYQLLGIDKNWVESGTRRTATYLHLPSGDYVFKVQGSNSQGIWSNKIASMEITVMPPWWRSWWAYLFYTVLLGLAVRAYFRFTINRAKLQSQLVFEQEEAKRAKELDTAKTRLYTNITHEFRTPLTVILGMAQQVISKPQDHFKTGMDMIIRNGENLLNLVNEMLDLSKLESGKMSLQVVNGDFINFLRYIVESFQSLADSQQKQLHFLSALDTLYTAYDPEKIRQIFGNLLSNALKFTPEKGNIYVSITEQQQADADAPLLLIKVKDTGIGIPEKDLNQVFERFYQADNSHTRKAEGTGIGLALTKELVRLMDGEISVKSPPTGAAKGTEFTISLRLKKIMASDDGSPHFITKDIQQQETGSLVNGAINAAEEKKSTEKPLILLVEDNADVVAYTASCLPDYRLAVGKDGREGFEIAAQIVPDLIITDVMMPFVDGFELCRQLRNDEHTSHVPIIMLTAKADMESKMEGLELGADAYLEKPFHREELLLRIRKLLQLRQNLQQYYRKKAGFEMAAHAAPLLNETAAVEHKAEDEFVKKVREAVEKNLSDSNFTVEQLCRMVFMSHSQLHRKLDALTGCSPNKFIRLIRLNKAKELLKIHSNSIASVSLDCGYSDPGYFGRIFKQEYGTTPQAWRSGN